MFDRQGYVVIDDVIDEPQRELLLQDLPATGSAGSRRMLDSLLVQDLALALRSHALLASVIGSRIALQCIYFRKDRDMNWSVHPHRDRVFPFAGNGPWPAAGTKEGQAYVRPPRAVVDSFVVVRVHLDGAVEGDLCVAPGSHIADVEKMQRSMTAVAVAKRAALVMSPSLLHGSAKLSASVSRRVLHFVFAPRVLPHGYSGYVAV